MNRQLRLLASELWMASRVRSGGGGGARTSALLQAPLAARCFSSAGGSQGGQDPKAKKAPGAPAAAGDELKIDLDELNRSLDESLGKSRAGQETEVDKQFMNFEEARARARRQRSPILTWKTFSAFMAVGGLLAVLLFYWRRAQMEERERRRKQMIGKARIGGEWELLDTQGRLVSSRELRGHWLLIYFGFTNCPDICPDEIEKMVAVVDALDADPKEPVPILPVFISVDPQRDTVERVKKYCADFSPKIRGFTGNKEQVERVTKAYRVYHSEGPKTHNDEQDYIVDHTVIMYLVDPDGDFHDYYGQNRKSGEIANAIRSKVLKRELGDKRKASWF